MKMPIHTDSAAKPVTTTATLVNNVTPTFYIFCLIARRSISPGPNAFLIPVKKAAN